MLKFTMTGLKTPIYINPHKVVAVTAYNGETYIWSSFVDEAHMRVEESLEEVTAQIEVALSSN